MSIRLLALALASLFLAAPVGAVEVYVNGIKVTGGIRNTGFERVNVRFDESGNVLIDAPGYKIQIADQPAAAPGVTPPAAPAVPAPTPPAYPPPTSATRAAPPAAPVAPAVPAGPRYWLVVNTQLTGHFKMLVMANGVQVAEIPATSPQYIADITDRLRPGPNQVQITYLPSPTAPAVPPTDAVSVMIGQGTTGGDGTLTIQRVLGTHKKQTGNPSADAATLDFKL